MLIFFYFYFFSFIYLFLIPHSELPHSSTFLRSQILRQYNFLPYPFLSSLSVGPMGMQHLLYSKSSPSFLTKLNLVHYGQFSSLL